MGQTCNPAAPQLPRVLLMGGAPCCGKTSAAVLVAEQLRRPLIATDDLGQAVRAMTDSAARPDLHAAHVPAHLDYHLSRSARERVEDALRSHRALWPAVRAVIATHANWAGPAVIEGWALLPELVGKQAAALWLGVPEHVIEERVRARCSLHEAAAEPEAFIKSFTARSVRIQHWLRQEAAKTGHVFLELQGSESPAEVARRCLAMFGPGSPVR